eukprot:TRINITY_DN12404_c0_g1_i7.p1 TRINITY_DN12404_c0_g1~~TRINITY_DN12404_c0_g1_i7.p1  ORF type:complete len:150 (+),score=30.67 TRINITY_DN12404_c0_g1_i7:44-493(+)
MGYVRFQENSLMIGNSPVLKRFQMHRYDLLPDALPSAGVSLGLTSSSLVNELSILFDPTPGPLWVSGVVEFDTFFLSCNSNLAIRAVCSLLIFSWAPDPFLSSMPSATYACWDIFLFSAIQRFLFKSAGLAFSMTLALLISDVAVGSLE